LAALQIKTMTKRNSIKGKTHIAALSGATAAIFLAANSHAQSADALVDKLVDKGILTAKEARDLRDEADKDFKAAFQAKTGMPDWVSGYKIYGDVRGRFDQISTADGNATLVDRTRFRYRLRFGVTANLFDNLEAGFRLTSDDSKGIGSQSSAGSSLSGNSTMQDNFSKKGIYIDTVYGKWTPINSGGWLLSGTIGKMENPFVFTPMVFDPDLTPEGGVVNAGYAFNDRQSIALAGGAFVMDEETGSTQDPFLYGGQVLWNAKWNDKISSQVGFGGFNIVSAPQLNTNNAPYINQGNTRNASGTLMQNYAPVIADASVTYTFDKAPFYTGAFPVKFGGEFMHNVDAAHNSDGYWAGITFGKSGTRKTWDLTYRYEYLEADAWYDQLVDDDNGAYYQNSPVAGGKGYFGGTNIKGHMIKFNYSFTDSLTFTTTCFVNDLINSTVYNKVYEPKNDAFHLMVDLMWKF
jgi:Putative porin